jgi:cell wall-associated NlpC family hydrolase
MRIERASRRYPGRLVTAVVLALSLTVTLTTVSSARPSKADLDAAKARLAQLNDRLSLLVEQYNQAKIEQDKVEGELSDARTAAQKARSQADAVREQLSDRAAAAYTGAGSELEALLGAETFSEFADRLQFVNQVAESDADLANRAEVARQQSLRAARRYEAALTKQRAVVASLAAKKSAIQRGIAEQESLVRKYQIDLERQAREAARRAEERARQLSSVTPSAPSAPSAPSVPSGPPPPVGHGASAAVAAAYSVLGTPYQWGGASPSTGFDCSGLTMWSWAHGGVSLPHSSAAQYSSLPHVSASQLQPGDLVFFYTPIHHVGIYVGGDQMIHSPHTGSVVSLVQFSSYPEFVGAARPG